MFFKNYGGNFQGHDSMFYNLYAYRFYSCYIFSLKKV
jgi:hypothetical protein